MKHLVQRALVALAVVMPCASVAPDETLHPLAPLVRADVSPFGPGMWSLSVRQGGYYSGHAVGIEGEFTGQLLPQQRDKLTRLLVKLPRQEREYRFGVPMMEGPNLTLDLQHPLPRTRYSVGLVTEDDQQDESLGSVVEVVEFLKALVPSSAERPATPWGGAGRANKGMKQTSVEHIGRSQLIPGVRRTVEEREAEKARWEA